MKKKFVGAVLVLVTVNCVGDPTGTGGAVTLQRIAAPGDTLIVGAPGRLLAQPVAFRLLDGYGKPLPAARVHWSITSGNGRLMRTDTISGPDGTLRAQWMLGTKASDVQRLEVGVHLGGNRVPTAEVTAAAVPVEVAALAIQAETTDVRLAVHAQLQIQATDPFGNRFVPKDLRIASLDSTVTVDSAGVVVPHHRGFARVIATAGGVTDTAVVHGIQVVASIQVDHDTLRFHSLGQDEKLGVTLLDDQGLPVADSLPVMVPSDTSVVALQVTNPLVVKSKANGVTTVNLSTSTASRSAVAVVRQRTASLTFTASSFSFDAFNDTTRAQLIILDSLGVPVQMPRITLSSSDTTVAVVDSLGLVTARENGSVVVTAQSPYGVTTTLPVTVAQVVASISLPADTVRFDALPDTLRLRPVALDRLGSVVRAPDLTIGTASPAIASIDTAGLVTAQGNGLTVVTVRAPSGVTVNVPVVVEQRVVAVTVPVDTILFDALHAVLPIGAVPRDRLGSPVADAILAYAIDSDRVATVDRIGQVEAHGNGTTRVVAAHGADSAVVVVRVQQRPVRVQVASDTLTFDALGEDRQISAVALDSLGSPVVGEMAGLGAVDTVIAERVDAVTVRSRTNGTTRAEFTVAGVPGHAILVVQQVPTILDAIVAFDKPIITLAVGAPIPLQCKTFDRNGFQTPDDPVLVHTVSGGVVGQRCSDLRVQRSGFDTLTLSAGTAQAAVGIVVAAAPHASSSLGDFIVADSIAGGNVWAPSAHRDASGALEIYYTGYEADSGGISRGNLYRLVSRGVEGFQYGGLVLAHDDTLCDPQGWGIENVTTVPRADGAGWRMFYAAGGYLCYGWQVFSAVSTDGQTWTKEPGIRLSNEGVGTGTPPWPAGEGMVVDRLPSGEWRMFVGTFEHASPPPDNQWQITEWRSPDQTQWTYVGAALTTRDMPAGWQGSVYSPTIREFAPGIWRMIFTADGRGTVGSRSGLWSAVSLDQEHWQVEGQLLGDGTTNLYYAALVDDQLVFIRRDDGAPADRLAIVAVTMP